MVSVGKSSTGAEHESQTYARGYCQHASCRFRNRRVKATSVRLQELSGMRTCGHLFDDNQGMTGRPMHGGFTSGSELVSRSDWPIPVQRTVVARGGEIDLRRHAVSLGTFVPQSGCNCLMAKKKAACRTEGRLGGSARGTRAERGGRRRAVLMFNLAIVDRPVRGKASHSAMTRSASTLMASRSAVIASGTLWSGARRAGGKPSPGPFVASAARSQRPVSPS
jgi:hypothetical protein